MSDQSTPQVSTPPAEKPQNGIAGFKHLRNDILSGIVVSLVSLPLSSGIAIASGCPPIYGLTSAIIAGLIFPFIGGAFMTISGPAAGLAPAVMAVMVALGGAGDAQHTGAGYPYLLVVIFLVGCCQLVISLLGLARYASLIPVAVVEGMLASIGLLIIVKQFKPFFGYTGALNAKEFYQFALAIPEYASNATMPVLMTSLITLVALFTFAALQKKSKFFQVLPPQLLAVILGTVIGQVVGLGKLSDGKFLMSIPSNLFSSIQAPHFADLLARRDLWYAALSGVVLLTMVDGVESLATAMAIDRIDPYRRRSSPNRVLLAMAVSNIASSLIGGLTIIPGGVKSKANIAAGGRTLWANFTNSICLILYIVVGYKLINQIPLGVLAAVLIFTGWKMCEPAVWRHMAHIGKEQVGIFTFTVVATLATDLLIGIIAGVVAKFLLNAWLVRKSLSSVPDSAKAGFSFSDLFANPVGRREWVEGEYHIHVDRPVVWTNVRKLHRELNELPEAARSVVLHMDAPVTVVESLLGFFQNPVEHREYADGTYNLYVTKPLVCFSSMKLSEELEAVPADADTVRIHIDERVPLIDHTTCDQLNDFAREATSNGIKVELIGMQRFKARSSHTSSVRIAGNPA